MKGELPLSFEPETQRYLLGDRELHCGDCFQLKVSGRNDTCVWLDVRIEHSDGRFYLISPIGDIRRFSGQTGRNYQ